MVWIVSGPSIAETDVEEVVWPERQVAAVVIGERLNDVALRWRPHQIEA